MPNGVVCSVGNCSFWKEGNSCGAQEIAIEIDSHSQNHWNEEYSEEFFLHEDTAPTSSVTCCLTFQPKNKK